MIKSIKITNEGYIKCQSSFYMSNDGLDNNVEYHFITGINELQGDIDSGVWAVSYLLSMYKEDSNDFILFKPTELLVNDKIMSLKEFQKYSCYLDTSYSLFSSRKTVRELVKNGLKYSNIKETEDDICNRFHISSFRFERELHSVGSEIFRAMAAIGYSYGKQVFCFPWLSQMRYKGFYGHITDLLSILDGLNKIVIVPIGLSVD